MADSDDDFDASWHARGMADSDDVLKKAGSFFSKLGSQVGKAAKVAGEKVAETAKVAAPQIESAAKAAGAKVAHTAKQVTGLGRGSVKLELDQTKAAPGGTISGRLVLALTEPVEAKRLVVALRARQKMVSVNRDGGSRSVGTSHADVYNFEVELGGATSYQSETLSFELTIPPDALDLKASPPTTPLGDVVRTVAAAVSPTAGPIEWEVIGRLQIPWGRDLTDHVDIVVTR
jgi:hypothetical protein